MVKIHLSGGACFEINEDLGNLNEHIDRIVNVGPTTRFTFSGSKPITIFLGHLVALEEI